METNETQEIARLQKLCEVYEELCNMLEESRSDLLRLNSILTLENNALRLARIELTEKVKEVARVN